MNKIITFHDLEMESLPVELIENIFTFSEPKELFNGMFVCKHFFNILFSERVWNNHKHKRLGWFSRKEFHLREKIKLCTFDIPFTFWMEWREGPYMKRWIEICEYTIGPNTTCKELLSRYGAEFLIPPHCVKIFTSSGKIFTSSGKIFTSSGKIFTSSDKKVWSSLKPDELISSNGVLLYQALYMERVYN